MGIFRATASNSPLKPSWTLAWVCVIHVFQTERELTLRTAGFNVDPPPVTVAAKFGIMTTDSPTWDRIDLDALSAHNIIEHDASISRNDFGDGTGDNTHFNETTFATLANSNPGKDYYDPVSAGEVQRARLAHSLATNPLTVNTQKEFLLRSRESALYLSIFGDPATGIASKEYVFKLLRPPGNSLLIYLISGS
jgi:hypothetical protein